MFPNCRTSLSLSITVPSCLFCPRPTLRLLTIFRYWTALILLWLSRVIWNSTLNLLWSSTRTARTTHHEHICSYSISLSALFSRSILILSLNLSFLNTCVLLRSLLLTLFFNLSSHYIELPTLSVPLSFLLYFSLYRSISILLLFVLDFLVRIYIRDLVLFMAAYFV